MKVGLCFLNDNGDKGSAGPSYNIEPNVLPRIGEHMLLEFDNDEFNKLAKTTKPTSNFKVMHVVHGVEDYDGNYTEHINLFLKPIYELFE